MRSQKENHQIRVEDCLKARVFSALTIRTISEHKLLTKGVKGARGRGSNNNNREDSQGEEGEMMGIRNPV